MKEVEKVCAIPQETGARIRLALLAVFATPSSAR